MEGWGAHMMVQAGWPAASVDDLTNESNVSV